MIAQIRAELLKIRSTRTTFFLVLALLLLILVFVLLTGLLGTDEHLTTAEDQRDFFGIANLASVFASLTGALVVTNEYRFGTIRPTFVVTPRRSRVVEAKLAASILVGLVLGLLGGGLAFGLGYAILSGRGVPLAIHGSGLAQLLFGTLLATALWGGIGAGVAASLRNQVGVVVALLAWIFVVEPVLFAYAPSVGRLTPGRAQDALIGDTTRHLVSPAAGAALLVAWTVGLAAIGIALTARRDVD